jgi:hypothetical protein
LLFLLRRERLEDDDRSVFPASAITARGLALDGRV